MSNTTTTPEIAAKKAARRADGHAVGSFRRLRDWLVSHPNVLLLAIALLPLLPYFDVRASFRGDWESYENYIGYAAQFLLAHRTFPVVYTTGFLVGMPIYPYYGPLLFPVSALIATLVGADIAFRVLLYLAMITLVAQVYLTARSLGTGRGPALVLAFLAATATYQLNDIYVRGDLPEFVAASLVTAAAMSYVRYVLTDDRRRATSDLLQAALFFALAINTHPITAFLGGTFFGGLIAVSALGAFRRALVAAIVVAGLCGAVTAPWLYVVMRNQPVIQTTFGPGLGRSPTDTMWLRLFPLPFDGRLPLLAPPPSAAGTPFFDTQINVALLVLWLCLVYLLWRRGAQTPPHKRTAQALLGYTCALLFAALIGSAWRWFAEHAGPFALAQFPYRFVVYVDVGLALGAVLMLYLLGAQDLGRTKAFRTSASIAVALAIVSTAIAFQHAEWSKFYVAQRGYGLGEAHEVLEKTNGRFLDYHDYASVRDFGRPLSAIAAATSRHLRLPVGYVSNPSHDDFGRVYDAAIRLERPAWVTTNVQAFPWNRLLVDGEVVGLARIRYSTRAYYQAIFLPPGRHVVAYRLDPDPFWLFLRLVAWCVATGLAVATLVAALQRSVEERRTRDAVA